MSRGAVAEVSGRVARGVAERAPARLRRAVLRVQLGAPRSGAGRAVQRLWRTVRGPVGAEPEAGRGTVLVDAWGLGAGDLEAHAAALAGTRPGVRALWLVSVPDLRPVTSRGWVVDQVPADDPDEHAHRLALLRRTLPGATAVAVPPRPTDEAWAAVLPPAPGGDRAPG